jgi:hypothetical protein
MKIPLNPLFQRGKLHLPLVKRGGEGFKKAFFNIIETQIEMFKNSVSDLRFWILSLLRV